MENKYDILQINLFLNLLYDKIDKESFIELRPIDSKNNIHSKFYNYKELTQLTNDIVEYSKSFHCFVGVLPRRQKQGTDEHVNQVDYLWIDIDAKKYGGCKVTCLNKIHEFPLKPTLIVDSGNGYHAYWGLQETYKINDMTSRTHIEKISKALHLTIGADSTFNLSRILRVPGTFNIKDIHNPKMAKIIHTEIGNRYTVDQIEKHVDMALLESRESVELNLDQNIGFNEINDLIKIIPASIIDRAKACPQDLLADRSANDFWVAIKLFEVGLNDAEVLQAFKLFAQHGWAAGDKVKRGIDYLIQHTLPAAKSQVNSLPNMLNQLILINNTSDIFYYIDKILELLIPVNALEQTMYLDKIRQIAKNKEIDITAATLKNRLKSLKASKGAGRFFEISTSGVPAFIPSLLGSYLLKRDNYMYLNSTLYRYYEGVYLKDGVEYASKLIQALLEAKWKMHYKDETIEWLKDKTHVEIGELPENKNLINLRNGMLNTVTNELIAHSKDFYSTIQFNVNYGPEAKCERLEQFMEEVFNHDAIETLWEFCGYVLNSSLELKKFLILNGGGNNGKSVFLNIANEIIGADNVANEPLQKLANNNFAVANLFSKVANINADLESDAIKFTGIIKMLTGGDRISAEIKYGDTFYFRNTARLLFSCNELPAVHDYNDAFFDRLLIVNCPNQFNDSQKDPHLISKLLSEEAKSAWLNFALEGMKRLIENKQFSESESIRQDTLNYRYSNDTVSEFISNCVMEVQGDFILKNDLYDAYKSWCKDVNRYPIPLKVFTKRAKQAPNNLIIYRPKHNGQQEAAFKDIYLNTQGMKYLERYTNKKEFNINVKNLK